MTVDKIQDLVKNMEPEEAAPAIAQAMKDVFPLLDEDARLRFVVELIGDSGDDEVASLVHL
jgi:hypothetical protein